MTISKWKHPIRYWRCVHTPSCRECRHVVVFPLIGSSKYRCANPLCIDYVERTRGVHYDDLEASSVRGTRWCRFESKQTEEERLDELFGEIEGRFGGADD